MQLANELGVSRTPLREVLRMLQREGLVESEHNRRVQIAPFSLLDLDEIYASRIVLEALALRLTVNVLIGQELHEMRVCWEQMRLHADNQDYDRWLPTTPASTSSPDVTPAPASNAPCTCCPTTPNATGTCTPPTPPTPWSVGRIDQATVLTACKNRDQDAAARAVAVHLGRTALSTMALVSPAYEPVKPAAHSK